MTDITTLFLADAASAEGSSADQSLSPRVKALVIIGLALAAWIPVLVPLWLMFGR